MRKAPILIPAARFLYNGYETNFETTDKEFATAIFTHLGKTVKRIKEVIHIGGEHIYSYEDDTTFFATTNKATALAAYEYAQKKTEKTYSTEIEQLKKEIEENE